MKIRYFLLLASVVFMQCGTEPKVDLKAEITNLETAIGANPGSAKGKIDSLLTMYEEFVNNPQSDKDQSIDYLLRAGEMASLINQPERSLTFYEKILAEFPDHPKAPTALFMKAYTLDDKLRKYDEAKVVYESFLAKYPDDEFADDTQFLLENLGKTEDEIIKLFEAKAGEGKTIEE